MTVLSVNGQQSERRSGGEREELGCLEVEGEIDNQRCFLTLTDKNQEAALYRLCIYFKETLP